MNILVESIWLPLTGLVIGGAIGFLFGSVQNAALARNIRRQVAGGLKPAWVAMPGSMGRVASLLLALLAVQVLCPLLFSGQVQWLVSAGILLGYGWSFVRQLRHRAETRF